MALAFCGAPAGPSVRVMTHVMIFHTNHYKTLRVRDPCTRKATKDDIMLDSGTHLKVL